MLSQDPGQLSRLLTNCNGERRHGSRNKTPYMGVPIHQPPLVAQTLQLLRVLYRVEKEGGGNRESIFNVRLLGRRIKREEVHEGTRGEQRNYFLRSTRKRARSFRVDAAG